MLDIFMSSELKLGGGGGAKERFSLACDQALSEILNIGRFSLGFR